MNIGLIEIGHARHYGFVEALTKIFSVPPENRLFIFTDSKGKESLGFLANGQIEIVEVEITGTANPFQQIGQFPLDRAYIVTLEAYAKASFELAQLFLKTPLHFEVNYVLHNVDFWFQQSLGNKLKRVFGGSKSVPQFFFNAKTHFYYSLWNGAILKKTLDSGGKLVVLSESVARELARFTPEHNIAVVPFSVYDGSVMDLSGSNKRIRLCLPGSVSVIRRDYFSMMALLENDKVRDAVELDFLGAQTALEGGDKVISAAKEWIAKGAVIHIYEKLWLDNEEYDHNLAKADIIMGNLHVKVGPYVQYGKSKESGLLFTMVKSAKPGLVPASYPVDSALSSSVISFKDYEGAESIILGLIGDPSSLAYLKEEAVKNAHYYSPVNIFNRVNYSPSGDKT